jgi:hypothetical protein
MIFKAKWFSHIEQEKIMCVCKENSHYWTIIIAPNDQIIFIITVYPSSIVEINQFKKGEELNSFELVDNGD